MTCSKMLAATSAAALALLISGPAFAEEFTFEFYGGATEERSENWDGAPYDVSAGDAFGFGIYTSRYLGNEHIELGLDLMKTEAGYDGTSDAVNSTSLMFVGRYSIPLTGTISVFGSAGIGAINIEYNGANEVPSASSSTTVAGSQLGLGVVVDISESWGLFGEVKRQEAHSDGELDGGFENQSYSSTSVVAGARLEF